ncbi:MAG: molybdopterin-binding protein, partial [Planctomycetota bacterium]
EPYQVRNVNGPSISTAATSIGITVASRLHVKDELAELTHGLNKLLADSQVHAVVTIGGVSVGDYDLVPQAIVSLNGRIVLHRVASKPGKPFLFAISDSKKPIFGLPGNPLSALVSFFEFVAPALRKMAGRPQPWAITLLVRLTSEVKGDQQRMQFVLARVRMQDDGEWLAEPIEARHSSDIVSAGKADGVILVPRGCQKLDAGQYVRFRPWRAIC